MNSEQKKAGLAIRKTIRGTVPRIPFERIARELLGARYEISLVICGEKLATRMNIKHRGKDYSPNVLSFPISKTEGEIFLNVRVAAREARHFDVSTRERIVLLFAHGCLHLKGVRHGPKMESIEQRMVRRFAR